VEQVDGEEEEGNQRVMETTTERRSQYMQAKFT
jgi:hypothetical protein